MVEEGGRALRARRSAPGAVPTRAVREPHHPLVKKPRDPLVDKASADPYRVGNVGDGYTISDEENNPSASGKTSRNGGGTLPCEERLSFLWGEGKRQSGFASACHR